MGSAPGEAERDDDEGPTQELDVPAFALDVTPVTTRAFEARVTEVLRAEPAARVWRDAETPAGWWGRCNLGSPRGDHPVNCVEHGAARAYCRLLGGDLPTEAQWERAARAGAHHTYVGGDAWEDDRVVSSVACGARGCRGSTAPVVLSGPRCNAWGLCDMTGNVWQWTATGYAEALGPYAAVAGGPGTPTPRPVHRGGSWLNHVRGLFRVAHRGLHQPEHGLTGVGLRCAYPLPSSGGTP